MSNVREIPLNKANGELADTEDAVASAFVKGWSDRFRYVPGWGWTSWEGTHWVRDDRLRHFNIIRAICRERGEHATTDSENRRLGSARMVAGAAQLARADQRIVHDVAEFDADPLALNTPAGMVDLTTGTMRPHAHDLVTKCTTVAPDFKASRGRWHKFLMGVFMNDSDLVDFMRRFLGYTLTGLTREQVIAFLHGGGANGKSTLLDLMFYIMGNYALKLPAETLMAHRGVERHPTDVAQLHGARLAISNEIDEGEFWGESKLKELTGDETLTGRFMRQDFFSFRASHKHIIAGNHRPQVRAMDDALRRRILLVPFRQKFEGDRRDNNLGMKLREDAPAILADLVEAAAEWHQRGLLIPDAVRAASNEYAATMDSIANWTAECCTVAGTVECRASLLFESYSLWKRDRGESPVSMTRWGEQMASRGYAKRRSGGWLYGGIDLTADARHRVEMGRQR